MDLRSIAAEANIHNPMKHHVADVISKVYDPVGIVSQVTIKLKILLQDLHCAKIDWNQELSRELLDKWIGLITEIKETEPVLIPRCYYKQLSLKTDVQWRLRGFSDASMRVDVAVVYLERCTKERRDLMFVSAKTRVAPTSAQTISRLELLGTLLLSRLVHNIHEALQHEITLLPSVCYTDSQIVLYWIKGEHKDWKPFVDNRVREIRELVLAAC
uniref:Uncharacterized protein n=1 Tax=Amphimedon queenslandica TaxID=400682 RepID=A0A1X7U4P5_AMPQE